MGQAKQTARIEYTVESRNGTPTRKARMVFGDMLSIGDAVDRAIDKLSDKGAFNFDVRYEVTR